MPHEFESLVTPNPFFKTGRAVFWGNFGIAAAQEKAFPDNTAVGTYAVEGMRRCSIVTGIANAQIRIIAPEGSPIISSGYANLGPFGGILQDLLLGDGYRVSIKNPGADGFVYVVYERLD